MMTLIVGLGNPEPQYQHNRHNIGFMAIDTFIGGFPSYETISKTPFKGILTKLSSTLCLKPMTYMNLSGESVRAVSDYYKPDSLIVVHDDLDLPFGSVRFKKGGGHGGHNGLRSIDAHMGSEYLRVRIGIGKPAHKSDVAHYVLSNFSSCEREYLPKLLLHVSQSLKALLTQELHTVTQHFSLKESWCKDAHATL